MYCLFWGKIIIVLIFSYCFLYLSMALITYLKQTKSMLQYIEGHLIALLNYCKGL